GYLLDAAMLKKLSEAGLDVYHITLDGPRDVHDRQRIPVNGRPTYDQIVRNIRMILERSEARVVLRVNAFLEQESLVDTIEDWLQEDILPEFERFHDRIDYYIVPVWDATTSSIEGICLSRLLDFQRLARLKDAALRIKESSLQDELSSLLGKSGSLSCYAGSPNSFVIGSDGSVYKCTVAVDLPANQVG